MREYWWVLVDGELEVARKISYGWLFCGDDEWYPFSYCTPISRIRSQKSRSGQAFEGQLKDVSALNDVL